jgi:Glycosyl hydrolases family 32 N-terminal domain
MRRTCTSHPPRSLLAFMLLAALALGGRAEAQAPISPARYHAPPGYRTKEFTLVRADGWFHIFYIRENLITGVPTELSLGHAMSRDLWFWAEQDTILPIIPGTFEGSQIWAPHLMKIGPLWHLWYPAMRHEPAAGYHLAQTMTEATSTDLFNWTRRTTPLFDNSIFPWAYRDTTINQGMDCRDPFVWWDAARNEWLMYVATRPASDPNVMAIGIAGSTDLENWSDRGIVPLTLPNVSFSAVAESPLILRRDDVPLLFMWTTDAGQSLTFGTSNDAVTGWTNSKRLRTMLGYTTMGWWAAETLVDGPREYFGNVHDTWIDFWDMTWTGPESFTLAAPSFAQVFAASFDRAEAMPGDTVRVEVASQFSVGRTVGLQYVRVRGPAADTLVAADWGLPDSVFIGPDSARVSLVVSPYLGDGRPCLLTVNPSGAGETGPIDTLLIGAPEEVFDDPAPEPLEPEPIALEPIFRPRIRQMHFTRPSAPETWSVQVFDVRGRLAWSGRAGAGERTLVWSLGGAGGAPVRPGIYFARMKAGDARGRSVKLALFGF